MAPTAHHDRLAFDELHRRYGSYVTNFVRRKLPDDEQVADVVQEVFLRLYRSAGHFDPQRQLRRWLFVIATNEVRRQWSRNNRAPLSLGRLLNEEDEPLEYESVLADPHPGPYELALAGLVSHKLRLAIDTLPDYQRTTLILRAYGELSLQQIAERMDCPISTVNSRLFYAGEKIRRMLADASFGEGAEAPQVAVG
jgi:RNA polymerase sigma-70 factor (ECF subfamily)